MRLREEGVRPGGRASAGRRLGVAPATAGLLGLTLTSGVVAAAPASAAPAIEYVTLENVHTEKCISSSGKDDTTARQYSCNSSANQFWYFGGSLGTAVQFKNKATGQCLGISGGSYSAGADAVVWNCLGVSHPDQYWNENFTGTQATTIYLYNYKSGWVLQVACGCTTSGAALDQEPIDDLGSPNQMWYI
jgi:Ricin-type beta-trefoil lectin domain